MKLVNFELEHVPVYEEWYKDKELLRIFRGKCLLM